MSDNIINLPRRETFDDIAKAANAAHERVRMLAMRNIAGLSYDEREASFVIYQKAKADAYAAQAKLDAAIRGES